MGFVNLTPFAAEQLLLGDERGGDVLTFVVKATYAMTPAASGIGLAVAEEQVPVQVAPEYYDDPETGSVKYDSDAVYTKLGTDVVLIGHAHAAGDMTEMDVRLRVGPLGMTVRVFGDRVWTKTAGRWRISGPQPFQAMPLVYERAFGGWDRTNPDESKHEYEPRNPAGVGFLAKRGKPHEGTPLPNLEDPRALIKRPKDRPAPVGFGFIGPHWHPRVQYSGTYDRRWEQKRMPLLPEDFDRRFYNAAHPMLAAGGFLQGGELVEVANASRHGFLRFQLPVAHPQATVKMKDGGLNRVPMNLDTVIVNTDDDRLFLVWRGSMSIQKKTHEMLWAKTQLLDPPPH